MLALKKKAQSLQNEAKRTGKSIEQIQLENESKRTGKSIEDIKKERNIERNRRKQLENKTRQHKQNMNRILQELKLKEENLKQTTGDPEGFDYYVNQISENNLYSLKFKEFLKSIKPLPAVILHYDYLSMSEKMNLCLQTIQKYDNLKEGDFTAASLLDILQCLTSLISFIATFRIDNLGQINRESHNIIWKKKCPYSGSEPNEVFGCKTNLYLQKIKNIINTFFDFFLAALKGMNDNELKLIQTTSTSYDIMSKFFISFFYFIGIITMSIPTALYESKFDEINKYIQSKGFDRIWFILDCNTEKDSPLCGRAFAQFECNTTDFFKIFLFNNIDGTQLVNTKWKIARDEYYTTNAKCGGYKKTKRNKICKNRKTRKYRQ